MWRVKYAYEEAALEAAKVVTIDEERRKAFLAGVAWAAQSFRRKLEHDHYEDMKGYPTKYMEELTLKDIRKCFTQWEGAKSVEDTYEDPVKEEPALARPGDSDILLVKEGK